jgi:hypothetical protein
MITRTPDIRNFLKLIIPEQAVAVPTTAAPPPSVESITLIPQVTPMAPQLVNYIAGTVAPVPSTVLKIDLSNSPISPAIEIPTIAKLSEVPAIGTLSGSGAIVPVQPNGSGKPDWVLVVTVGLTVLTIMSIVVIIWKQNKKNSRKTVKDSNINGPERKEQNDPWIQTPESVKNYILTAEFPPLR